MFASETGRLMAVSRDVNSFGVTMKLFTVSFHL